MRKQGIDTAAVLYVANDYGKANCNGFSAAFTAEGGKVLLKRSFPQGTTDFKSLVTQIAALKQAQKVFIVAYPDEYRALFQELNQVKFDPQRLVVSDTFYSPKILSELGPVTEGVACVTAAKPEGNYKPRKDFIEAYRSRFKNSDGSPSDPGLVSDTAYDALCLIVTGINKTDGSPKAVSNWLLHDVKDYPGVAGVTNFTDTGDMKTGISLYQVKNGKFSAMRL